MDLLHEKQDRLKETLAGYGKLAVAYSAGVDSTYLLYMAVKALGAQNVLAVTAKLVAFPEREFQETEDVCDHLGVTHVVVEMDQMQIPGFSHNPEDRCYLCKKALFTQMLAKAKDLGFSEMAEGSNVDDRSDYRPGRRAIHELLVHSPLEECEISKAEIRALSKEQGLPTWSKPSMACLVTRFPYDTDLTEDQILRVDRAEVYLFGLGFSQVRVRSFPDYARVEVAPEEVPALLEKGDLVVSELKKMGFPSVELSKEGYRTGSMNDAILQQEGTF